MRFLFDCDDEICMPMAYNLVDDIKPFIDKIKEFDVSEEEAKKLDRKAVMHLILKNAMVKYPKDTSKLLAKLWLLEEIEVPMLNELGEPITDKEGNILTKREMEKAPNVFKTMSEFFTNEVAINFFTSVLPSLLQISREILPR